MNIMKILNVLCVASLSLSGWSVENLAWAATSPSQAPLYSAVPGAKPNLMLVLDNSGSMAFEYQDNYKLTNTCKGTAGQILDSGDWKKCSGRAYNGTSEQYFGWYSMRSSDFNSQYYNPSVTYLPRVGVNGAALINPFIFLDNQSSGQFAYSASTGDYSINSGSDRFPKYVAYTSSETPSGKFTYVSCLGGDCSPGNRRVVEISYPPSGTVNLPASHTRTDCGKNATTCTQALELKNILNWYVWYRSRSLAVSTSVGQALQGYENKFRIGYAQYNTKSGAEYKPSSSIVSGVRYFRDDAANVSNNWKTKLYQWLYDIVPAGGTPSHQAVSLVADYLSGSNVYAGSTDVRKNHGNPWKNDPTSDKPESNAEDLSCRRSFSVVISDGAWNSSSSKNAGTQFASIDGSTNFSGTPGGNSATLKYAAVGAAGWNSTVLATRLKARNLYIPFSDKSTTNGLADLTANLFWNKDFSSVLNNNVLPLGGRHNPTFWQNMTTYTIGWGLTPSGDIGISGGLQWSQINKYTNDWLSGATTLIKPSWADGQTGVNLNSSDTSDYLRVNDFIRAGYTGGGRAYSVYSGDDVRKAIDNALSSMVGSGNDAGVAVSGNSSEFQSLENQFKFTTEYSSVDNTGDVKAFRLNANGGYLDVDTLGKPQPAWSAKMLMPLVANRKMFALSNYDPALPAAAKRLAITSTTTLDGLPSDLKNLLQSNSLQKSDSSFVRYILGEDPHQDVMGTVYRPRISPIGASVNSPPVFVGGRSNMGYDVYGAVEGSAEYADYRIDKQTLPPTIFAATNNGKVHVLNAAKNDTAVPGVRAGQEVATFMPKGSMASQIDLASSAFRFRYTLDGPLAEHDVYDKGAASPKWRQLVFGTGGRAGPFLYGLESPRNAGNRLPSESNFLWEVNAQTTGYSDMSHVTNLPTAGQLDDGTWVMLTGSGQYPASGKKVGLYVVNALTGGLVKFIPLPSGWGNDVTGGNRGLGGVVAVRDTNRKVVAAYAGDANGNLWRFDLRTAKFAVSYGKPLFTTPVGKGQPIYATPTWQTHPGDGSTCTQGNSTQCGAIVVVGTGILLDESDLDQPATRQAIYGIWDKTPIGDDDAANSGGVSSGDLVEQTIDLLSEKNDSGLETGKKFYQASSNKVDWKVKRGWLMKMGVIPFSGAMTNGERVVGDPSNLGSSVIVTSYVPEDKNLTIESCTATGSLPNIIYTLDALTGKNKNSYDVNGDSVFDAYSIVAISDGGFTRGNVSSRNLIGQPNEGTPDLKPQTECTNETGFLTGVGGTQKVGDGCAVKSWRRSWRTVVKPPF